MREAARVALLGGDAVLAEFVPKDQYDALAQDYRTVVIRLSLVGSESARSEAQQVLQGGRLEVLQGFALQGWKEAWLDDDRRDTYRAVDNGSLEARAQAKSALRAGDAAVAQFMLSGKEAAENADLLREAYRLAEGSPAVAAAAKGATDRAGAAASRAASRRTPN